MHKNLVAGTLVNGSMGRVIGFKWAKEAQQSFELLKKKVIEAPIPALPDFNKVF